MYKKHKLNFYLQRANNLRREIKSTISTAYKNYIRQSESELQKNPQKFWSFINAKKNKSRIPGIMCYKNENLTATNQIVNAFADHFKSVYLPQNVATTPSNNSNADKNPSSFLHINYISNDQILSASKKLKNKLSTGPDNIPL